MAANSSRSAFTNDQYSHDLTAATCDPQEVFNTTSSFPDDIMRFQPSFSSENISRTPPNSTRPPSLIMESSSSDYSDFSSPSQASSFDSSSSYIGSSRRSSAYTFPSSPSPSERPVVISGLDDQPWEHIPHQLAESSHFNSHGAMSMTQLASAYSANSQWNLPNESSCSLNQCSTYNVPSDIKVEASQSRQVHYSQGYNWLNTAPMPVNITPIGYPQSPADSTYQDAAASQPKPRGRSRKTGTARPTGRNRVMKSSSSPETIRFNNENIEVLRPDDKVHVCEQGCNQKFAREEHRKRHERKHLPAGEKHLWKCPIKGCTKSFSGNGISDRRDNLTQHINKTHGTWTNKKRGHTNVRFTMRQILEDCTDPDCLENWLNYLNQDSSRGARLLETYDLKGEVRKIADKQRWQRLLKNEMEWDSRENKKSGHASMTGYWKLIGWSMEEALHVKVADIAPEYLNSTYKGSPETTLDQIHPMWKAMRRGQLTVTQCQNQWDPINHPNQGNSDEDWRKTRYFLQFGTLTGYEDSL